MNALHLCFHFLLTNLPDISLTLVSLVNWAAFMKVTRALKDLGIESNWLGANMFLLGLHALDNSVVYPSRPPLLLDLLFVLTSVIWPKALLVLSPLWIRPLNPAWLHREFSSVSSWWVLSNSQAFIMCPFFNASGRLMFSMALTDTLYSSSSPTFLLCTYLLCLAEVGKYSPALEIYARDSCYQQI